MGLKLKPTQSFNCPVVTCHFQLLGDFLSLHNIPWENIYNMDEKGIQVGCGGKDNTKYLYAQAHDLERGPWSQRIQGDCRGGYKTEGTFSSSAGYNNLTKLIPKQETQLGALYGHK